ncbi:hypothetical protein DUNSADRAFT_7177 [Dunaliella salina]|uniref:SnoaL-like domain-containing protein n=1 Tax=Dunaliella salina TaxID=3046 RepID=A0ABQ7GLU2_DUNSA|nr:hypothetical protein DUNSADRAFT_7177 [Dunaliella salina]|eukprot:KAF5835575.1 hypothetical protein DUNSADRAFT_7177 [Dunaliella salina]
MLNEMRAFAPARFLGQAPSFFKSSSAVKQHYFIRAAASSRQTSSRTSVMQSSSEHDGVLALVNKQFELYNARDLEKFMDLFTEDVIAQDAITDEILASGKAQLRSRYEKRFSTPVHAELLGRLTLGPVVHDREVIFGLPDNGVAECLATYVVDTSKSPYLIKKVKFVWKPRT